LLLEKGRLAKADLKAVRLAATANAREHAAFLIRVWSGQGRHRHRKKRTRRPAHT
jgi:hypothetical protein